MASKTLAMWGGSLTQLAMTLVFQFTNIFLLYSATFGGNIVASLPSQADTDQHTNDLTAEGDNKNFSSNSSDSVYLNSTEETLGNNTTSHGFLPAFVESFSLILACEFFDKTFFIAAIMAMTSNKLIIFLGAISALALMTILSALLGCVFNSFIPREYTYYLCTALMFLFGLKMLWEAWRMKPDEAEELQQEVQEELQRRGSMSSLASNNTNNSGNGNGNANGNGSTDGDAEGATEGSTAVAEDPELEEQIGMTDKETNKRKENITSRTRVRFQEKSLFGKKCYKIFKLFVNSFTMTFLAEWGDRSQLATIGLGSKLDVVGVCVGGVLGHCICTGVAVVGGALLAKKISVRLVTLIGALVFLGFAVASLFFDPDTSQDEVAVSAGYTSCDDLFR